MAIPVQFSVLIVKCPKCNSGVDYHLVGISSFIGPSVVRCSNCETEVTIGRMEWRELSPELKRWFFGVSILYVFVVAFLGGASCQATDRIVRGADWKEYWNFAAPSFWIGTLAWGAVVAILQLYRIVRSLKRTKELRTEPIDDFFNLQVGMQFKLGAVLLVIPLIAFGVMFVVRWIAR